MAEQRSRNAHDDATDADGARTPLSARIRAMLPPRYRDGRVVSSAPMGSAALVYGPDGRVAWGAIWEDFCDLALAGGPPHRATVLQPGTAEEIRRREAGFRTVADEIERGLRLVTGWEVVRDGPVGWVGLVCADEPAAEWLELAIAAENIAVLRDGQTLFLPAGPSFRVEVEIKSVITSVAKTHHYWVEHAADDGLLT